MTNILENAESIQRFLNDCESGDPLKDFYDEDDLASALVTLIHRTTSPDDDNELLTHEWLTSIGFTLSEYKAREGFGWFDLHSFSYYYVPPNHTEIVIAVFGHPIKHIKTHGQLRRLLELLTPVVKTQPRAAGNARSPKRYPE